MTAPVPPGGPLRLTTARWFNKRRIVKGDDGLPALKVDKALVNTGPLTQYAYGTYTEPPNPGDYDWCAIGAPHTRVFFIDVDNEQSFLTTRTSRLAGRDDAWSTTPRGYHIPIDARGVPPDQWPKPGPIGALADRQYPDIIYPGADIKSNGWVPLPGSRHWSGERYEPVIRPGGQVPLVPATPELIAAVNADRADYNQAASGHGHGGGSGTAGGDIDAEKIMAGGVAAGQRNHTLYRFACSRYRRHGTSGHGAALVLDELRTAWQTGDTVGMPWSEVATLAWSARQFIEREDAKQARWLGGAMRWAARTVSEPGTARLVEQWQQRASGGWPA